MNSFLPDLPFNLVILIGFIATGLLFASGTDANWLFSFFKSPKSATAPNTTLAQKNAYPRSRLTARILLGASSAIIICASLAWLANYDFY